MIKINLIILGIRSSANVRIEFLTIACIRQWNMKVRAFHNDALLIAEDGRTGIAFAWRSYIMYLCSDDCMVVEAISSLVRAALISRLRAYRFSELNGVSHSHRRYVWGVWRRMDEARRKGTTRTAAFCPTRRWNKRPTDAPNQQERGSAGDGQCKDSGLNAQVRRMKQSSCALALSKQANTRTCSQAMSFLSDDSSTPSAMRIHRSKTFLVPALLFCSIFSTSANL